jgi:ATP-binding cassette subfamily F protein 2
MLSMPSVEALWLFPTISGMTEPCPSCNGIANPSLRLLDKIAKDIMVCEKKTIRRWDGSIAEYKNYLRKKMVTMGQV